MGAFSEEEPLPDAARWETRMELESPQRHLLVIGGSCLVGRRLRNFAHLLFGQYGMHWAYDRRAWRLKLDASAPEHFSTEWTNQCPIVCAPLSRITEALLERLHDLGMRRLVVLCATGILTKATKTDASERENLDRLYYRLRPYDGLHQSWGAFSGLRPTSFFSA
jgi:hypothetical protein